MRTEKIETFSGIIRIAYKKHYLCIESERGKGLYKKYIEELKNGKKIRIKYKGWIHDYCGEDTGWSEELWSYDSALDLFKCYYPTSTYKKDFYTTHTQKDAEYFLIDAIRDCGNEYDDEYDGDPTVIDIIVEDCGIPNSTLSIREAAINKIKTMSDEEIKKRILL